MINCLLDGDIQKWDKETETFVLLDDEGKMEFVKELMELMEPRPVTE